jgi:hypothetical protein
MRHLKDLLSFCPTGIKNKKFWHDHLLTAKAMPDVICL